MDWMRWMPISKAMPTLITIWTTSRRAPCSWRRFNAQCRDSLSLRMHPCKLALGCFKLVTRSSIRLAKRTLSD
jgi:hypothetical protein